MEDKVLLQERERIIKQTISEIAKETHKDETDITSYELSLKLADKLAQFNKQLLLDFAMRDLNKPISDFNREGFERIVDRFLVKQRETTSCKHPEDKELSA